MRTAPSLPVQFWLEQPLEHALIKDVRPTMSLEVLLALYLRIQKEKHPELPLPVALGPSGLRFTIEKIVGYQALEALVDQVTRPPSPDVLIMALNDESLYTQPLPLDPRRNGHGCLAEVQVSQVGSMNQDPATELKTILLSKHAGNVETVTSNYLHRPKVMKAKGAGVLVLLEYAEFLRIWDVVHSMHLGLTMEEQYEVAIRIRDGNPYEIGDTVRLRPIHRRALFPSDVEVLTVVKHLGNNGDPREHDLILIDRDGVLVPSHSYHYDPYNGSTSHA